jgi:hypothetical protein
LDEIFVKVNGKLAGVDREGEVVEMVVATELDEVDSIVKGASGMGFTLIPLRR